MTCPKDYRPLFRFLLACTFAEPHALGYDPTMRLVKSTGDVLQCDIVVRAASGEESLYRTSRSIFDGGADDVISKGTRVWEALRVDPESGETTGEPVVLKDSWVGRHREREGDILARIRESASSLLSEVERGCLEDTLVTVMKHGDVHIAGEVDYTRPLPSEGVRSFGNLPRDPRRVQVVQVHYRAVYKELCQPLRTEPCLANVFQAVTKICSSKANTLYASGKY